MEIPQRGQKVSPPSTSTYKRPVSTIRAEEHLQKAREYRHQAHMFTSVMRLGTQVLGLTDQILAAREATDLMKAETTVADMQNDFLLSLQDPEEPIAYEEWEQKTNEVNRQIKEQVLSNMTLPRSKKEFEGRYERIQGEFADKVAWQARKETVKQSIADFYGSYNKVLSNNSLTDDEKKIKAYEYIAGAEAGYIIDPSEANRLRAETDSIIAFTKTYREMGKILEIYGPDGARKYISSVEGITEEGLNKLEKYIADFEDTVIAQDEEALWDLYRQDKLDDLEATIDKTRLPAFGDRSKTSWLDKSRARRKQLASVKKSVAEKEKYDNTLRDFELRAKNGEKISAKEITGSILAKPDRTYITGLVEKTIKAEEKAEAKAEKTAEELKKEREQQGWEDDYNRALTLLDDKSITDAEFDTKIESEKEFRYLTPKDREHFKDKRKQTTSSKDPNSLTNAIVLDNVMDVLLDPTVPTSTKRKVIRDNTGADENGNPRISNDKARTLDTFARNVTPDYYMKDIASQFKQALDNEWITQGEYAQLNEDFFGRIAEGDLSTEGIRQLAENLLIQTCDTYAKKKFKEDPEYDWKMREKKREEEIERYIEEHELEKVEIPDIEFTKEKPEYILTIETAEGVLQGWDGTKWVTIE